MTNSKDRDAQLFDELLQRHGGAGLATGLRYYPFDRQGVSAVILEMGLPPLRPNVFPQIQERMARSDDRNAPIFLMETHRLESLLRDSEIDFAQINRRELIRALATDGY